MGSSHSLMSPADPRLSIFWAKQHCTIYRSLSHNIVREICLYLSLSTPKLVRLTDTAVVFLDVETGRKALLAHGGEVKRTQMRSVVWLNDDWVIICGGLCGRKESLRDVFEITRKGTTKLRPMHQERFLHGVVHDPRSNSLYVFGGEQSIGTVYTATLRSAEVYHLASKRWRLLPPMVCPRHNFQPCMYQRTVVLAGGNDQGVCEVFEIGREEYRTLGVVVLPGPALTVLGGQGLITCSIGVVQRWSLTSVEVVREKQEIESITCCTPAVYYKGKVYFYPGAAGVVSEVRGR